MGCALLVTIANLNPVSTEFEVATIAGLTAGFGVKRRTIQYDYAVITFYQTLNLFPVFNQCNNAALFSQGAIAEEFSPRQFNASRVVIHFEITCSARTSPLLRHRRLVASLVYSQAALASNVVGQVYREPIGIIKSEYHFAGYLSAGQVA